MDLVGLFPDGLRTPDLTVAALLELEVEVRRVGRQLEYGDANVGYLHVKFANATLGRHRRLGFESVATIQRS